MPSPTKGPRLGGGPAHERLLLATLATQLLDHRKITTTQAKAKRVRPLVERMITFAKRGDLASRRRVMTVVKDKTVVHELFTSIAPAVADRPGGYTRITKIGNRKGDNAPMAVIELVLEPLAAKPAAATKSAPKRDSKAGSTKPAQAADVKAAAGPHGPDSAAPNEDGSAPEGFAIKGNADSMKYHTPDSQWYDQTVAEVYFTTEQAAQKAGFVEAGTNDNHPHGPDSVVPNEDGSAPAGYDIKGNADSMKYHTPDSQWYDQTVAEVYFKTEEAAQKAGFVQAGASEGDDADDK